MSHTMKPWERVIEHHVRGMTRVTKNQFGFMPRRSTMEAIFLVRQLWHPGSEDRNAPCTSPEIVFWSTALIDIELNSFLLSNIRVHEVYYNASGDTACSSG